MCRNAIVLSLLLLMPLAMQTAGHAEESKTAEKPTADAKLQPKQNANESGGMDRTTTLIASLTIFVLAVFVGFEIITKVPPTLHTPLMSGSNAISGITLVGALLVTGSAAVGGSRIWGALAVVLATINVVGGFLVTHRMLAMFSKPRGSK